MDKSLVERITDPLTHLVATASTTASKRPRRRAAGKPEPGRSPLSATTRAATS